MSRTPIETVSARQQFEHRSIDKASVFRVDEDRLAWKREKGIGTNCAVPLRCFKSDHLGRASAGLPAGLAPGSHRQFGEDCGLAVSSDTTPARHRARVEGAVRGSSRASETGARLDFQRKPGSDGV